MMQNLENFTISKKTERLTLETLTQESASPDYASWMQDEEILRYLEARHAKHTQESCAAFISSMLASADNLLLGIFLNDGHKHIGNIKIGPIDWRYQRSNLGIIIGDKNSWGKGYATEAIMVTCAIASEDLKLRKLQAGAYVSNQGSIKAFEKAGFEKEGQFKNYWLLDGQPEDDVYLGKCL